MSKAVWTVIDWPKPVLPLSEEEYETVHDAWRALTTVVVIEDLWELLVQNYLELESAFLQAALRNMVREQYDHGHGQDERLSISRPMSNLLSSCRGYLDQTCRSLKHAGFEAFAEQFIKLTNREYDAHPIYRLMEEMRNHAQHRGVPFHATSTGGTWSLIETDEGLQKGTYRFFASASIDLQKLRSDRSFKRSVLADFEGEDRLDVLRLVRGYIEALSRVHIDLRTEMKASVGEWKSAVRQLISRYSAEADYKAQFVVIGDFGADAFGGGTQVFEDMLARIEALVLRNPALVNLSRRYVSSELTER